MDSEIILYDEDGEEIKFELIATFGVDERDICALSEDGLNIVFFEMIETDEGMNFVGIEEDELEDIIEVFESLLEEKE